MTIFLVCSGDGSDGSEWQVHGIFSTRENAERFVWDWNAHRPHWTSLNVADIEEHPVDCEFNPADFPHDPVKEQR